MCGNTTKQRIGAALRRLMTERPFDKITVQNLMDATNMKRQSFYYHFRDTRDVLLWICRQELMEPLRRSELEYLDWAMLALEIVERDRSFYRKAVAAAHPEILRDVGVQVLWSRTARLLYSTSEENLDAGQRFVVDFMTQAALEQFLRFCADRTPLDCQQARSKVGALLSVLHPGWESQ